MDKREVKRAFRAAMALEFAAVPRSEEAVAYSFTQDFCCRMDALIAERKRGSWRLMRKRARRVLIAAILAVLLALLVACSPNLRMVLKDFVVDHFGGNAEFIVDTELHEEIKTRYWVDPSAFDLTVESQKSPNAYFAEVCYRTKAGGQIVFLQRSGRNAISTGFDTENVAFSVEQINGYDVAVRMTDDGFTCDWVQDGYYFSLIALYLVEDYSPEQLIAAVQVMDTEVADG